MSTPHIICQVCELALDRWTGEDGAAYQHPLWVMADHDPVPVQAGADWRGMCDFCLAPHAEYELPARDFRVPDAPSMSMDDWACCEGCALLIDSNRWNNVLTRTAAAHERRWGASMPEDRKTLVRRLHRELRRNITGSIRRIGEAR